MLLAILLAVHAFPSLCEEGNCGTRLDAQTHCALLTDNGALLWDDKRLSVKQYTTALQCSSGEGEVEAGLGDLDLFEAGIVEEQCSLMKRKVFETSFALAVADGELWIKSCSTKGDGVFRPEEPVIEDLMPYLRVISEVLSFVDPPS